MYRSIFITLASAIALSSCAVYVDERQPVGPEELGAIPAISIMSPDEYDDAMRQRKNFFIPLSKKFKVHESSVDDVSSRSIFSDTIDTYRKKDGNIDCDIPVEQTSAADAEYWIVVQVYNESEANIGSVMASGLTLGVLPSSNRGQSTLSYNIYAAGQPRDIKDEGSVSVDYTAVQHILQMSATQSQAEQAKLAGEKMFCDLLMKSLKDAKANYAFY
ncbi:hypothetical protein [Microbulbifer aggregans]|uniref:hypothetical protein n=1 Tax=Microbulbifer aggregans TaxID=1769779 RepID=UPI001CFEBB7E|nr:hypothetical protein [Microbulbifer aggregans]